jgi:cytochrome c-type biogenesis protein CcsB
MEELFDPQLASLSNNLFHAAFITYIVAMVAYFFRMAFTKVSVDGAQTSTTAGRRIGFAGTALAIVGVVVHTASVVMRGMSSGRVPWANMYEYSSVLALLAVVVGLYVVQRRFGFGHLMGFVLMLSVITMAVGLMLYTDPGPVVPALESYWIRIHVTGAMVASSIFIVAFAVTALYLVKDTAERRLAARSGERFGASTVGAASVDPGADVDDVEVASPLALREVLSPVLFPVIPLLVVAVFVLVVWRAPVAAMLAGSVAALVGIATWYAVPYLPSATQLDNLAYRTTAFAFPIWTFAVIAGAIWAEEAWGRYWGWDPKETGSFFTWVLYAGYLHARATHGWRGARAAWIGVVAFVALMVTYYAVNLFVVSLHSYAGV